MAIGVCGPVPEPSDFSSVNGDQGATHNLLAKRTAIIPWNAPSVKVIDPMITCNRHFSPPGAEHSTHGARTRTRTAVLSGATFVI